MTRPNYPTRRSTPEERGTIRFYIFQLLLLVPLIIIVIDGNIISQIVEPEPEITDTEDIYTVHPWGVKENMG